MDRKEIVKFINENNVGLDRGAGLITALEMFAEKVREDERNKVKALCKERALEYDIDGNITNALENFADEL